MATRSAVAVALALVCGCGPRAPLGNPSASARVFEGWRTYRAEHRVTVEAAGERRTLRGLIAVERPGKLRLRALGPAGITLFDVLIDGGRTTIVAALRSDLSSLVPLLAADLAAAYRLAPQPADRAAVERGGQVIVRERDRTITLSDFRAAGSSVIAGRIAIDDRARPAAPYHVEVVVVDVAVDEPLDAALFTAP